jgi:hypothetical protein
MRVRSILCICAFHLFLYSVTRACRTDKQQIQQRTLEVCTLLAVSQDIALRCAVQQRGQTRSVGVNDDVPTTGATAVAQ